MREFQFASESTLAHSIHDFLRSTAKQLLKHSQSQLSGKHHSLKNTDLAISKSLSSITTQSRWSTHIAFWPQSAITHCTLALLKLAQSSKALSSPQQHLEFFLQKVSATQSAFHFQLHLLKKSRSAFQSLNPLTCANANSKLFLALHVDVHK